MVFGRQGSRNRASLVAQLVKTACNEGDLGSIPGLGRPPGEGKDKGAETVTPGLVETVAHFTPSAPVKLTQQDPLGFPSHEVPLRRSSSRETLRIRTPPQALAAMG